jgi:hypothetical protein
MYLLPTYIVLVRQLRLDFSYYGREAIYIVELGD